MNHQNNLQNCKKKTIFLIGDIMLDEFHWCHVNRLSPEAPVPVCTVTKTTLAPGGAGNVACNIIALNSCPKLFGFIGNDSSGDRLLSLLKEKNIDSEGIIQTQDHPTILKSRIIAHQQHVVRVDRERKEAIPEIYTKQLLDKIKKQFNQADIIILSDYMKGTLPPDATQEIIALANQHKIKVIVDPKGTNFKKYTGASLITPNFSEFLNITKKTSLSEESIFSESKKLINTLKLAGLLVTRSENGMSLIFNDKKIDIPTQAKEVFDITGAGDTVIAMISIALANHLSLEEAVYLGNYAAGIVVGKKGTATTTLHEIEKGLMEQ